MFFYLFGLTIINALDPRAFMIGAEAPTIAKLN